MSFNYLYYPSISLPNDAWLRKVLLYSENIASIVPFDLEQTSSYNIELLTSKNEYTSLSPEKFLSSEDTESVKSFKNEVIDYFNSNYFKGLLTNDINNKKSLLHNSKFTSEIISLFEEMKFFEEEYGRWSQTPQIVGDIYLGILAKHMGGCYNYIPTTNSLKTQDIAFKNSSLPKDKIGELRLIEALPLPSHEVSIREIVDFKNKRRQELLKFRTVLRENIEKLSMTNNDEELLSNLQIFKEEIEIEVNDLTTLLKENRINFTFESVKTLINLDKQLISKAMSGAILSATNGNSPITGALVGATSDVVLNISSVIKDYRIQKNLIIKDSPYAYAFYSNQFINRNSSNRIRF